MWTGHIVPKSEASDRRCYSNNFKYVPIAIITH